ncbi:hypothetical protein GCM10007907_24930 [Chitinimonas prasina]|uniref:Conjugal transfer protein TraN n=1 Tax=Chitinimonas prasina TaxID=1434937 RepID=A0ABQ5YJ64_9NEIS|nr:hypothetical protein [Chitinimonas prasina]GLR13703.1 hypothetical protein GCM10007907_24930 [Chitinimonas prasina]
MLMLRALTRLFVCILASAWPALMAHAALDPNFEYSAPNKFRCDNGKSGSGAASCNSGEGALHECNTSWSYYSKFETCSFKMPGATAPSYTLGGTFSCADGWQPASDAARVHFGNKFYCQRPKTEQCTAKKDQSYSFSEQKVGRQAVEQKAGCESGCQATLSDLSCVNLTVNGSFTGALCSGSATYTGASCQETDPPPEGEPKEPASPSDCAAGFRFVNVSGKNKCVWGDGGDKKTDFCKEPANQYSQTCSEGGEENCKANPTTQACTPGTDRYCAVSPKRNTDPACVFGTPDWCKQHPAEKACTPGADEYCALNPTNAQCQEAQAAKCKATPDTPECKKAEQCAKNPNDPACKPGNDDYCKKFPNEDKCKKSEFGGTCGTNGAQGAFNCTGDAIQCAIAKEQHRRSCQLFDGTATAYEAMKTESAGPMAGEGGALKGRYSEVSMAGKFDGVRAAAGGNVGTCNITDRDVAIPGVSAWSGGSVRIPLSIICEYGDAIRAIFLFMSAMSCTWLYYQFLIRR